MKGQTMNRRRTLLIILCAMLFGGPHPATARLPELSSGVPDRFQQSSVLEPSTPFQDDWRLTKTDHFDITFRVIWTGDLERIARSAERAYRHVGSGLMYELSLRPLIVVYGTRIDLQRAIASRSFPGDREHMLWTLDTPVAQADGTFVHELTHVFVFDIVPVSVRRDLPGWLQEGLAEFERGEWTDTDLGIVRELLRSNTFPTLLGLPQEDSENTARLQKIVGHLAIDFLVARAGQDILKRVLLSLRENVVSPIDACLAAAKLALPDFDREFIRYVRDRFAV
jgi:hypothetical protein